MYRNFYQNNLAPFSSVATNSKGKVVSEKVDSMRSIFQRDRDRIIHSTSFRRLKHKTQVFVGYSGETYRTRLTHTLEVAQIARTLAQRLRIDESLTEAIALAHDLGHPPFGHAGEDVLDEKAKDFGGFNHNEQTFKIVTKLEKRYVTFDGLNLSWEMLEGLAKHSGIYDPLDSAPKAILEYNDIFCLDLDKYPSLEAQCAAISDEVAYNAHDIDDGLGSGILTLDKLQQLPWLAEIIEKIRKSYPGITDDFCGYYLVRELIKHMVEDIFSETHARLQKYNINSLEDVYNHPDWLVSFSADMDKHEKELKRFLLKNLYLHESVLEIRDEATNILSKLFDAYVNKPSLLPENVFSALKNANEQEKIEMIIDYLASITDRKAIIAYKKIFSNLPSCFL